MVLFLHTIWAARTSRYLTSCIQSKEGALSEKSPVWVELSAADQRKRQAAAREKALKLKSPNFFVSRTRLHIMNIPLTWGNNELKACARAAVLVRSTKATPKIKQARSTCLFSHSEAALSEIDFSGVCRGLDHNGQCASKGYDLRIHLRYMMVATSDAT